MNDQADGLRKAMEAEYSDGAMRAAEEIRLARLQAKTRGRHWPTVKQNAQIIREETAAPEMLAALENLENDDGNAMPPFAWALVKAAIAKARGGE